MNPWIGAWTKDRHLAVKARCEAATKGPWLDGYDFGSEHSVTNGPSPVGETIARGIYWRVDRDFIRAARVDLPDALQTIERLVERVESLVATNNKLREGRSDATNRYEVEVECFRGQLDDLVTELQYDLRNGPTKNAIKTTEKVCTVWESLTRAEEALRRTAPARAGASGAQPNDGVEVVLRLEVRAEEAEELRDVAWDAFKWAHRMLKNKPGSKVHEVQWCSGAARLIVERPNMQPVATVTPEILTAMMAVDAPPQTNDPGAEAYRRAEAQKKLYAITAGQASTTSPAWQTLKNAIETLTTNDPAEALYADVSNFTTGGQFELDHGALITEHRVRMTHVADALNALRPEMEAKSQEGASEVSLLREVLSSAETVLSELDGGDENNLFEPDLTKIPHRLRMLRDATEEAFRGPDRLFSPTGGFWSLRDLHKLAWDALGPHGQAYVVAKVDEGLSGYPGLSPEKRVLIDCGVVCMPGKSPTARDYKEHLAKVRADAEAVGVVFPTASATQRVVVVNCPPKRWVWDQMVQSTNLPEATFRAWEEKLATLVDSREHMGVVLLRFKLEEEKIESAWQERALREVEVENLASMGR